MQPHGNATQRRARRRHARGAALVEAVVVVPAFILVFVCLVFVGKLYAQKEWVMRTSKERAWVAAMGDCSGKDLTRGSAGAPLAGSGVNTGDARHTAGGPGVDRLSRSMGSVTSEVHLEVRADRMLGGWVKPTKSATKVMCNEIPEDGNLLGLAKTAYRQLSGW